MQEENMVQLIEKFFEFVPNLITSVASLIIAIQATKKAKTQSRKKK